MDIGYAIALKMMRRKTVPSVEWYIDTFGISRASAYRWQKWTLEKIGEYRDRRFN
jgi:hypothetical protein